MSTAADPGCTCSRHSVCPAHLGIVPLVVEAWRVVDQWWTSTPVVTNYRVVRRRDGQLITERANDEEQPLRWEAVPVRCSNPYHDLYGIGACSCEQKEQHAS